MDNKAAVQCISKQGSSWPCPPLRLSEKIFQMAGEKGLILFVFHILGSQNLWTDMLSHQEASSVSWSLRPQIFQSLVVRRGLLDIDLLADSIKAKLPCFITRFRWSPEGGLGASVMDWTRW